MLYNLLVGLTNSAWLLAYLKLLSNIEINLTLAHYLRSNKSPPLVSLKMLNYSDKVHPHVVFEREDWVEVTWE